MITSGRQMRTASTSSRSRISPAIAKLGVQRGENRLGVFIQVMRRERRNGHKHSPKAPPAIRTASHQRYGSPARFKSADAGSGTTTRRAVAKYPSSGTTLAITSSGSVRSLACTVKSARALAGAAFAAAMLHFPGFAAVVGGENRAQFADRPAGQIVGKINSVEGQVLIG